MWLQHHLLWLYLHLRLALPLMLMKKRKKGRERMVLKRKSQMKRGQDWSLHLVLLQLHHHQETKKRNLLICQLLFMLKQQPPTFTSLGCLQKIAKLPSEDILLDGESESLTSTLKSWIPRPDLLLSQTWNPRSSMSSVSELTIIWEMDNRRMLHCELWLQTLKKVSRRSSLLLDSKQTSCPLQL